MRQVPRLWGVGDSCDWQFQFKSASWRAARMDVPQNKLDKAAIARSLAAGEERPAVRKRLLAVALVWEGEEIGRVVRRVGVTYKGLRKWLARAEHEGVEELLRVMRGPNLDRLKISGDELRRLAAHQKDQMFAGRLKAVAQVADGMTVMDAAAKAEVSVSRLTDWVKRCVEDGPGALRMPPGNMKIADRQLGLRELVARGPARAPGRVSLWTVAELRAELWNVLRLRYSRDGIKGLMKRLGYSWPKQRPGRQRREAFGLRLKAVS